MKLNLPLTCSCHPDEGRVSRITNPRFVGCFLRQQDVATHKRLLRTSQ